MRCLNCGQGQRQYVSKDNYTYSKFTKAGKDDVVVVFDQLKILW